MSITVSHLTHIYHQGSPAERTALSDMNLVIHEGSITAIIGVTGSGKSTLVQHFNGLLRPSHGEVQVDDISVTSDTGAEDLRMLRRKVGLVFQFPESQLFAATVYDDVAFGPRQLGLSPSEISTRVMDALRAVALEPTESLLTRSPFALSGGQRRRVAIAGTLAMHPAYLVLDEPSAGLDAEARDQLYAALTALRESLGITIIMVTHDMVEVSELADYLYVLCDGKVELAGQPAEVFRHAREIVSAGLLPPPLTEVVTLAQSHGLIGHVDSIDINTVAEAIRRARQPNASSYANPEPPAC